MKKIFNTPEIEIMFLGVQDDIITWSYAGGEGSDPTTGGAEESEDW